jgi:hypothetical protein
MFDNLTVCFENASTYASGLAACTFSKHAYTCATAHPCSPYSLVFTMPQLMPLALLLVLLQNMHTHVPLLVLPQNMHTHVPLTAHPCSWRLCAVPSMQRQGKRMAGKTVMGRMDSRVTEGQGRLLVYLHKGLASSRASRGP